MHTVRSLLGAGVVALLLFAFSGCGSSGPAAVVQVGDAKIDQANVEHWAKALTGQAFTVDDGIPAPRGVLANLASQARCAASAAPVAETARRASKVARLKPPATAAQLRERCSALYASAKQQATEYLISVQEALAEADKYSIKVSPADTQRYLTRWKQANFTEPDGFAKSLVDRAWTLSDAMFDAKRAVLWLKLTQHLRKLADASGGGEKAYADLLRTNAQEVANVTRCNAGYVVTGCKGYRPSSKPSLSLAVAVEHLVGG
jgi:hypothetical protein